MRGYIVQFSTNGSLISTNLDLFTVNGGCNLGFGNALVAENGSIYLGGCFQAMGDYSTCSGTSYNSIAQWTNGTWQSLSFGLQNDPSPAPLASVQYLAVDSNAVYAFGGFNAAGGVTVTNLQPDGVPAGSRWITGTNAEPCGSAAQTDAEFVAVGEGTNSTYTWFDDYQYWYLGLGQGTNSVFSFDGMFWEAGPGLPFSDYWESIAYGNGKWVAVAMMSTNAAYSTNGIDWSPSVLPVSDNWISVTYGDGKFVAVAQSSTNAAYSDDGETWTLSSTGLPKNEPWTAVGYGLTFPGGAEFMVISGDWGDGDSVYSSDGVHWTGSPLGNESGDALCAAQCGDGASVAVGYGYKGVAITADGVDWTAEPTNYNLPAALDWTCCVQGDCNIVAIAYEDGTAAWTIGGAGGISAWTTISMPSDAGWVSAAYGKQSGLFVAIAQGTGAAYSGTGTNWSGSVLPVSAYWTSVAGR
jgi:hypothetical protein